MSKYGHFHFKIWQNELSEILTGRNLRLTRFCFQTVIVTGHYRLFNVERCFNIFYHDKNVSLKTVKEAVKGEHNDPGMLLGYRARHLKIKQKKNGLNDTGDKVYDVMRDVDLEGLRLR